MNFTTRLFMFCSLTLILSVILYSFDILFNDSNNINYFSNQNYKYHHRKNNKNSKSFNNEIKIVNTSQQSYQNNLKNKDKIFLWWTPITGLLEYKRTCSDSSTEYLFTINRDFITHPALQAIFFYGSNFVQNDIPLPRNPNIPWILYHEESPKNQPFLSYDSALSIFNLTATFSRWSTFPLTLQYLTGIDEIIDGRFFQSVSKKNEYQITDQLASIVYVQSICNTMSGRDDYVQELMKFINIDSYGKCLNNKEMPKNLTGDSYLDTISSDEFYEFLGRYKFIIAYENSICDDYITEKLWRPLLIGVIPIYFGAPNVKMWLPNKKSAIFIEDYENPRYLAEYLQYLNEDDVEYNSYLLHKLKPMESNESITNQFLLDALDNREYNQGDIISDFECYFANLMPMTESKHANQSHYNCLNPLAQPPKIDESSATGSPSTKSSNYEMHWEDIMKMGKCEANVFRSSVEQNRLYTAKEYQDKVFNDYSMNLC